MSVNIHQYYKCPSCGSEKVIFDPKNYTYICENCGLVLEDHPCSYGLETRFADNRVPRTSGVETFKVHDRGIGSTEIDYKQLKDKTKWINIERANKGARISKSERIVERALRYLNMYAKILNTPNFVVETAGRILTIATKGKNYKSKTVRNMAIASLFIAYKIHGLNRPAKLIAKEIGIKLSELWDGERRISDALGGKNKLVVKKEDPSNYVELLVKKLNLSNNVRKLSYRILFEAEKHKLGVGKPVVGLASASVYIASILLNEKKTQIQIADCLGISDVMIRNRYSEIVDNMDITVYI
uniref:Transcription initiation factor IIB n=1 Tax=Staphylothermus marinus TaxID=2280 RepID=A0A7C4NVB6_STAMA